MALRENKKKITPDFARLKFLFFYPQTTEELTEIIRRFEKMGMTPRASFKFDTALKEGVGLVDGEYVCGPNVKYNGASGGNWVCTLDQLSENYISPEEKRHQALLAQFAALAAQLTETRQELADLRAIVGEIHKEVVPTHHAKVRLPVVEGG